MFRVVLLFALAACGRFGFDASPAGDGGGSGSGDGNGPAMDVGSLEHDEDGDGVADVDDNCPHLVADQADMDGDTVGDACDPLPSDPGESIALFATMAPGDQPFTLGGQNDDGVWTQLQDSLRFDGALGADNNLYGHLQLDRPWANVRVALGMDILAIIPGSTSNQNQIALAVAAQPPLYFVELNQISGVFDVASITYYDGVTFSQAQGGDLANGIHPGSVFFQTTQQVSVGVKGEISWPGEPYSGSVSDSVYQGASRIEMNINNVHFQIRYLIVITSP